ncbi:MAG TPA: c-type cytochrome [Polyangiaceae bacterium]|nr:c-type cytochrome [Polyangiaceae bacterium]
MKKLVTGLALATLVALSLLLYMSTASPDARPAPTSKVEPTEQRRKRGSYLVNHVVACLGCHSKRDWNLFGAPIVGHPGSGGSCFNERWGMPGRVCPPNITPDKASGLGAWTDGEVMRAIREGVDRHGEALFPMMPYRAYRTLSDEDTRSIVVYLRSLKRRKAEVERSDIDFPASFFITLGPAPLTAPVTAPPRGETAAYGEYLATIAGCKECHTPLDASHQPLPGTEFAGGRGFKSPFGLVRAPNLTPHPTGLGSWSKEAFIKRFHAFRDKAAAVEVHPGKNTPMPWLEYSGMAEEDLGAIFDYLRQLPAVDHRVEIRAKSPDTG